ncbi:MAG TPA: hypothetical protein QF458_02415 [Candidatus Woesearchaeota archaeon]|jgi:hypothetical protein|nr:hypothetical protein [Candidatus Woesearchaeota archaeon]|tara:strand:- start:1710 stop:2498 length:789 start_codon:yes stop_codon:yes gene_type:complete
MIHIAIRSLSIKKKNRRYTTPGLGDRIHTLMIGYLFSQAKNDEVTVHLTSDKGIERKLKSYQQLLELFPSNTVHINVHDIQGLSEAKWIEYLQQKNIDAKPYFYKDYQHLNKLDKTEEIDISKYFKNFTPLKFKNKSTFILPTNKFVVAQFDSTDKQRGIKRQIVNKILENYTNQGYEILVVGGGASNELLMPTHPNNIVNTAYVISNAELYVGVDSSMMHMASMFLPGKKLHLYHTGAVEKSHHLLRNIDNGAVLNNYGLK